MSPTLFCRVSACAFGQQPQSHEQRSLLGREDGGLTLISPRVPVVLGNLRSPAPAPSRDGTKCSKIQRAWWGQGPAPPPALRSPTRPLHHLRLRVFWAFVLAAKHAQSPTSSVSDTFLHDYWSLLEQEGEAEFRDGLWPPAAPPWLSPGGPEPLRGPSMSPAAWWRLGGPCSRRAAHRGPGALLPQTGWAPSRFRGPSLAAPWTPPACHPPPDTRGRWPLGRAGSVHLQTWFQQTNGRLQWTRKGVSGLPSHAQGMFPPPKLHLWHLNADGLKHLIKWLSTW